jgi:hypothetical protein
MAIMHSRSVSVGIGTAIGVLLSIVLGLVYFSLLREPGSAFYPFAGLICAAAPVLGGTITAVRMREKWLRGWLVSAASAFAIAFMLFVLVYVVSPQFARSNVKLPAACDGFDDGIDVPDYLVTSVPGVGDGILIVDDTESSVVAVIDVKHAPFPSTAYLLRKRDNSILLTMHFPNDVISAAMADGTLYLFNDKLGYLLDTRTGKRLESFLIIDNYGGLTTTDRPFISRASDGAWYMETTAIISSWNVDGSVVSRPRLTFNGIARGCFVDGDRREVTQLSR